MAIRGIQVRVKAGATRHTKGKCRQVKNDYI